MFLPIDTTKTYVTTRDCLDGLKGQQLHDISSQIVHVRRQLQATMQQENMRKKVLPEEITNYVEEYLDAKFGLARKFHKQVFELQESKQLHSKKPMDLSTPEVDEIRDDVSQLKKLILNNYR